MRIGVFFVGRHNQGGLYQYSLCILDSLRNRKDEIILFNLSGTDFLHKEYRSHFKVSTSLRYMNHLKQLITKTCLKFRPSRSAQVVQNYDGETAIGKKLSALRAKEVFFIATRLRSLSRPEACPVKRGSLPG